MGDNFSTYVQPGTLLANLDNPNWLIIDCTNYLLEPDQGYEDYRKGHIPNSIYAHLNKDLSGKITSTTGRHPLPKKEDFESLLSRWGFAPGMQVVAYDTAGGSMAAARLWWLLNYCRFPLVAILSGGIQSWKQLNYPLSTDLPFRRNSTVTIHLNDNLTISAQEIRKLTSSKDHIILDGRAYNRYLGMDETIDPIPGHIPGAISAPVTDFLDSNNQPKPVSEIKSLVTDKLKVKKTEAAIYYCGSGVTAAFGIFSIVHAGFPMPKLYPGSWSEWIKQPWAEIAVKP